MEILQLNERSQKLYDLVRCGKKLRVEIQRIGSVLTPATAHEHECPECSRAFQSRANLQRHLLTHADPKAFKCQVCSSSFTVKQSLKAHIHRVHTMERPEACTVCPKQFLFKTELRNHMKLVHDPNPASHKCPVCFKGFRLQAYLKIHMQIHASEPPHKCEICPFAGFSKADLKVHVRKVHDKTRYPCTKCPSSYSTNFALQTHVRVKHGPPQVFKCSLCDFTARAEKNLKAHRKRHEMRQEIPCPICPKKLSSNSSLNANTYKYKFY